MELIVLVLIGILGGLIAGSMGVGGGIIFTPMLFFLFEEAGLGDSVPWSIASGLLCTFTASLSSTIRQTLNHNLYVREGVLLGIFGGLGISVGKWILTSGWYEREQFVVFFSLILLYAAFMMFKRGQDFLDEDKRSYQTFNSKAALFTGGIGGSIASLAGVGGGGVMVPIMNLMFKQPFRKAVSISHLGMCILIFVGLIQLALIDVQNPGISPYHLGYIDVGTAFPLALGGLVGANFGTILNHKIDRQYLQWGFALLATIMAIRLLWGVFGS